ncbi:Oidioi.mRNA.OKI2018_I69.chr2.g4169.t1.cds [Oikopleura dioica]|uniref:Oidioi.mRNA.OKI2018_I69.chr2.g4169.t1.cds n=1 Tax=Oikopleura dioica TaxID=34765 RepID=A0ABN7T1Z8_OIKDI|nr:Oidioi.mRNA.OKI2018_I69.chr2.g4169.t1.cds [Oikopleura dioica]
MKLLKILFAAGVSAQHWSFGFNPSGKKRSPEIAEMDPEYGPMSDYLTKRYASPMPLDYSKFLSSLLPQHRPSQFVRRDDLE